MAFAQAALVKVVTASTGTNDYVLEDPGTQGSYRTDVQAVADGSLSNGDTVHYVARDTTVTGDAEFEEGYGVYTSATRTVARTAGNVIDSDGGPGTLKSWGLSGQRDFVILRALNGEDVPDPSTFATNLGLPRLSAANTFTAAQTIRSPTSPQLLVDEGSGAGQTQLRIKNTNLAQEWALRIVTDSNLRIRDITGGSDVLQLTTAGALLDGSGNKYDAFPSGTKLLFGGTIPAGWSRQDATQSRILRMAKSGDTIGATGGVDDIFTSWSTLSHTLTVSEIPNHNHGGGLSGIVVDAATGTLTIAAGTGYTVVSSTGNTGGGGSHDHNMSTPFYEIWAAATKD